MSNQPTHQFEFPQSAQDAIEANLRSSIQGPIESVRKPKPTIKLMQEDKPKVTVETPPVTPVSTAEGISVDLPSKFYYYDFKDLYILPMRIPHLAKISKAHATGDLQTQVEAISSLLFTSSGDSKDLAFKLTMADYQAVLYWLRMTSFSKHQMRVDSFCQDATHNREVSNGTKPQDSLKISTVVYKTDLKFNNMETAPDTDYYSITVDDVVIPFVPETLADTIQFLAHPQWTDDEFQYKSRIAAVLSLDKSTGKTWTWDQRIQFVDKFMDPDMAIRALEFADFADSYGVVETIETKCTGCGSKGVATLTCDPLTFLHPKF